MIVSKFGDHLPLYRLEDILVRSGVYISRSTLGDWVRFAAELFLPLYELQRQRVLQSTVMWTDDTPVTVIGGLQGSFQGHFWAYLGYEQPYSVYDFTKSHARDGPARFLQKFTGYLHADAFTGYDASFGVSSADRLRAQLAAARPESSMHGGIPRGGNYYHVDVSLFDARNGGRIRNAQVEARVENLRLGGETRRLEPMTINGGVSYGSYFRMPGAEPYAITVGIVRPGEARPIEIRFEPRTY